VLDEVGSVVEFDGRLRPIRRPLAVGLRELDGVASAPAGGLWLADARGQLIRVDSVGRPVGLEQRPRFAYTAVTSNSNGLRTWLSRSPRRFGYDWDSTGGPLLLRVDSAGREAERIGRATLPEHVMLQDIANAGTLAVANDGRLYFAPFIRDEIVAFGPAGDTLWAATRGLPQSTHEPRFEIEKGRAVINYHPVNLGISVGPDGNVYVLSTPGFTTERSRLDVLDPSTGALLRSAELTTALPTLAVDVSGRVYALDATRLLTGAAEAERVAFPRVALETLSGDTFSVARERGRVLLINVWASWCAPCREEMPALDSLRRTITDSTFTFVTINVDATRAAAEQFMRDFGFEFPVALAGANASSTLHYVGLPYTLLVDRKGRVAQRWSGYAGPQQITGVGAAVHRELGRIAAAKHSHQ
jgi:thiol-disulfide isomerase/thioredoxin